MDVRSRKNEGLLVLNEVEDDVVVRRGRREGLKWTSLSLSRPLTGVNAGFHEEGAHVTVHQGPTDQIVCWSEG